MTRVTLGLLVVLAVAAGAASPFFQPAVAASDSMEPAIPEHAVYVVDTAGPHEVEVGDVVLFEQPRSGRLVTHRVVDVTPAGYVTQGDANDVTDQAAGAAVVTDADVVGVVPSVFGHLLVVPFSGLVVGLAAEQPVLMALAGWLALLGGYLLAGDGGALATTRTRSLVPDRLRVGDVLAPVVVLAFLVTAAILAAGVTAPVDTSLDTADGAASPPETSVLVERPPLPYVTLVGATDGARVVDYRVEAAPERAGHDRVLATVETPAATTAATETTGSPEVTVHHVPPVLPVGVLRALYALHPVAAALGATTAAFVPLVALGALLVDPNAYVRLYPRRTA